jgi:hypothetical protein
VSNPSKDRGTRWETAVARYLAEQVKDLAPARRNAQRGRRDIGDVWVPGFSIECKDHAKIELASFVDQALSQAINAEEEFGLAVVKRRRRNVAEAYVVTNLETAARLISLVLRLKEIVERLELLLEAEHPYEEQP